MTTSPASHFESACLHLVQWIDAHPILGPAAARLDRIGAPYRTRFDQIRAAVEARDGSIDTECPSPATYEEQAALSLAMLRASSAMVECELALETQHAILECVLGSAPQEPAELAAQLGRFAAEGLVEYLDEHLDGRNAIYGVLIQYRERCEQFRKERLRKLAQAGLEGRKGDRALHLDLCEYLFDQGVGRVIEPGAPAGETGVAPRAHTGRHLVIGAKHLKGNATRAQVLKTLAGGVAEVHRCCQDLDEPEGFLVAYLTSASKIDLALEPSDGIRFVAVGGKRIYPLPIDIAERAPASKGRKARAIMVGRDDLVSQVGSAP